jgi:mono/diheme cytochrome c family protein
MANERAQAFGQGDSGVTHRFYLFVAVLALATPSARATEFVTEIEPILQENCFDCHGPDQQESQLRLDRLANMLAGGNSGEAAVVPENPEASYLLKLIRHEEAGKEMPPDESLSAEQIQLIESWIASGAPTPERYGPAEEKADLSHWAFQPVRKVDAAGIDDFILQRLGEEGLSPSSAADRRTLIRRLHLVMHGLPPTPEQVEAFVRDDRDDAWNQMVEEVLASPHFGQRWATFWLDLVRFGETHGFETNRERPNAWRYRDWVIASFNEDKPYDQFIREQLAGDALDAPIGTGFLVAGPYDLVKGQDPKLGQMQRMNELDDMINTTGTAFLGLTTGCARCHNHKFDPIRQRDYYAMQAVFAGVSHGERALPLSPEKQQAVAELETRISDLKNKLKQFIPIDQPATIVIEESDANHRIEAKGQATKVHHNPSTLGDSKYTWWKNLPGNDIVRFNPLANGRYRIWISWGAGYATHCQDARYVIRSGSEEVEIATVDQRLAVGGTGTVDNIAKWSGLHDAGVHLLSSESEIVLIGGDTGTAITADAIVLQPESTIRKIAQPPTRRLAVQAKHNEERFTPTRTRRVRFSISKTNNGAEACLDELEVYSGTRNVALASEGAKATSSGDFVHELHKLEHINDGQHGNARSWIAGSREGGWVQLEFAQPTRIDRVVWGRDRTGAYNDRLPIHYKIEAELDAGVWTLLASSNDRHSSERKTRDQQVYQFAGFPESEANQGRKWLGQLKELELEHTSLAETKAAYAGTFSQPGPTHRLYRGEPDMKREQVAPGGIEAFNAPSLEPSSAEQQRRLMLAQWIAHEDNPLTARVIVNRLWQFHFGVGIVDTPSDFGINGSRPTHPELLDWLAAELIENGWSLKHIHRCILHSSTWRQSNRPNRRALSKDAESRLLWRFPPRRLEAEAIRDSILSVSGALVLGDGKGPGFSPFEVQMENVRHYHAKQTYGPQDWRRMIFMTRVRQEREQVFGVFDCPDASMVVPRRSRSTTPLQALNLLNSRFVIQQADLFAKRLETDAQTLPEQIMRAWELCFQRTPTDEELADSKDFIRQEGIRQFTRAMLNANEFVFIP